MTFHNGLGVLEAALAIGRQADALAFEDVQSRMDDVKKGAEAVQQTATKSASPASSYLVSKLKSWFGTMSKPEAVG